MSSTVYSFLLGREIGWGVHVDEDIDVVSACECIGLRRAQIPECIVGKCSDDHLPPNEAG